MEQEILEGFDMRDKPQKDLDNAGGILAMGIISIPFFGGIIGIILAILTLVKSKQAINLYNEYPQDYTEKSLKRVKAGRTCAIVSLSLLGVTLLVILGVAATN